MDRRHFLGLAAGLGLGLVPGVALSGEAFSYAESFWRQPRTLNLYRPVNGERLKLTYWNGDYDLAAYSRVCWLLRDVRAERYVQMDPKLLDLLFAIQQYLGRFGYTDPVHILSGYRSKATNDALIEQGAAKNSMHLYGKAIDFRVPHLPTAYLARLVKYFQAGGVGTYLNSGFVHMDTGRVRFWGR